MKTKLFGLVLLISLASASTMATAMEIEHASKAQKSLVQAALGEKYPVSKTAIIKSGNHRNAYYLGAIFSAEGVGSVTGVWLTSGNKEKPGPLYSVDGAAYQFSGMKKASETQASASVADPEAKALQDYLK